MIQVEDFRMIKVHLDFDPFAADLEDRDPAIDIDFNIGSNNSDPTMYLMLLSISGAFGNAGGHQIGPEFELDAAGEFRVPDDVSEGDRLEAVIFNGGLLLYGMVRGHVATITGSFPCGTMMLPTIDWRQTVNAIAKKQIRKAGKKKSATAPKGQHPT